MSYLAIIQPIQPLGLVSSKVPKIKDNTLAKADSMAPAMLRRYKIHPFRKALRPRPGGCFVIESMTLKNPRKIFCQVYVLHLENHCGFVWEQCNAHPSDQRLEVSKFGNPMKRSHAEMATDMWEILGFKRALSIFPEPRHPKDSNKDETTPSRLN